MNNIRKITEGNRGFTALLLILVFLNVSFGRNVSAVFSAPVHQEVSKADNGFAKQDVTAQSDDDSKLGFWDQFKKDTNSDDFEFVLFDTCASKLAVPYTGKHEYAAAAGYKDIYAVPLYDLYCNWKFHLI
jgi:hypothetical protein